MKLRFRSNTLRLRMNRREVESLAAGMRVEESVWFPNDKRLSYAFGPEAEGRARASFDQGSVQVTAPWQDVQAWARGEELGLYYDIPGALAVLKVAIEKDLECMDSPAEERDPEAFPREPGRSC